MYKMTIKIKIKIDVIIKTDHGSGLGFWVGCGAGMWEEGRGVCFLKSKMKDGRVF